MTVEKVEKEKSSSHGGARPGSGRKPDLDKKALDEAMKAIKNHGMAIDDGEKVTRIEKIYEKLYDLGMEKDSLAALTAYLDRQLGKPKEKVDITTDGEKITGFNYIKHDTNNSPTT